MTPGAELTLLVFAVVMLGLAWLDAPRERKPRGLTPGQQQALEAERADAVRRGNRRLRQLEDVERRKLQEITARHRAKDQHRGSQR